LYPEDSLLFICARQNFGDSHRDAVRRLCHRHKLSWDVVLSTAERHQVAPLIYFNILQCSALLADIPTRTLAEFKRAIYRNIAAKEKIAEITTCALSYLNRRYIEGMLIKGAALDIQIYEQPWFTTFKDVDLVLRHKAEELPDGTQEELDDFLYRSGIEYDYFQHHDIMMNRVLPVDFDRIWLDARKTKFNGEDVFVMSPEDMLISLCINSCRKRYFRLKSLCDIAETLNKYPELDWKVLKLKAVAYECNLIVYTALLLTRMTVGCKMPVNILDELAVSPIRSTIIHYLSRYLNQCLSLGMHDPSSARSVFGRKVNLPLLLVYSSYRSNQIGRKMREICNSGAFDSIPGLSQHRRTFQVNS
jgi:hypothetical protein